MTEGTPPNPDQPPQYPGQPAQGQPGQPPQQGQPPQPPPYGGSFGQPGQPGQPSQPGPQSQPAQQPPASPSGQGEPPAYAPQQPAYGQEYGGQPAPYGQSPYQPAYAEAPRDPDKRPGTVLAAAIITWAASALALIGGGFMLLAASADRDAFIEEIERDEGFQDIGWSGEEFVDALNLISIVTIVLSLAAIVLAVAAFYRSSFGRIALVTLSSLTALVTLAGSIFCVPALWLAASVTAIVLLFTGGANDWYARRTPGQQPAYPQPGDYGQWPQA